MALSRDIILWLAQRFYPNGRAFRMPESVDNVYVTEDGLDEYTTEDDETLLGSGSEGGILYRLHRALSISLGAAYDAARAIQDAQLPDNPKFTIDDAHAWYRRLGIYDSGSVSLEDMKAHILQVLSFPQVPLNRQNYLYIQQQLRAAGFDVYVYENRFLVGGVYVAKTPAEILGVSLPVAMHGFIEHGMAQHGQNGSGSGITKCVNYIEEQKDLPFVIAPNWRSTFFVAGATITTFATLPAARKIEFRQLLLKLKVAQAAGFLFIHYT